jgi:hypothetical protein
MQVQFVGLVGAYDQRHAVIAFQSNHPRSADDLTAFHRELDRYRLGSNLVFPMIIPLLCRAATKESTNPAS